MPPASPSYAAGLGAKTIVWIAPVFTEQHRAALDWLNENTVEDLQFFGIQLELWRVGNSLPAPRFHIVSKPNDWVREVADAATRIQQGDLSETKKLQLEFWTEFKKYVEANTKDIRPTKPIPETWMSFAMGRSGYRLYAVAST